MFNIQQDLGDQGLTTLNRVRSLKILGEADIPPVAIVTAQEKKLKLLRLDEVLVGVREDPEALARTRIWSHGGHRLCTLITGVGGPSMDRILVSAVLRGVKVIIRLGTAGLVRPGAAVGEIVVPTEACGDCTVYSYYRRALTGQGKLCPREPVKPSRNLLKRVQEACAQAYLSEPFVTFGRIFSTGLIMHEHRDVVSRYKRLGCVAADMETAPLLAGAEFFGVSAVAIHVGSDHMLEGHHHSNHAADLYSGVTRLHSLLDHLIPYACDIAD